VAAVTLASLLEQVRDLADEPTSGGFAVDNRLIDYINHALGELHGMLVTAHEDYFLKQQTVTLVGGTESYALPDDYLKTYAVFTKSGTVREELGRFTINDLPRLHASMSADLMRYRVMDSKIWFAPAPAGAGTVEHWYIYAFTPLAAGGSIHGNIPKSWEDFVVCSAAHRLLVRGEGENANEILALKNAAQARVMSEAEERDAGEPHRVVDVTGRFTNDEE
jgi:hypothetical protein